MDLSIKLNYSRSPLPGFDSFGMLPSIHIQLAIPAVMVMCRIRSCKPLVNLKTSISLRGSQGTSQELT